MSTQPQALALAAQLEDAESPRLHLLPDVAALLRTQHAEIEASNRNLGQLTDELAQCSKARADLEAENKRLREALQNMKGAFDTPIQRRRLGRSSIADKAIESARAALEIKS